MPGYVDTTVWCITCGKAMRVWRWRGTYSHIGGEGTYATLLPEGYICDPCHRERIKTREVLMLMDGLVNG